MWKYPELTKAQKHVVDLMREGWEFGLSVGRSPHSWIQKGGLGRGGASEHVSINIFKGLHQRGVIFNTKREFPTNHYALNTKDEVN